MKKRGLALLLALSLVLGVSGVAFGAGEDRYAIIYEKYKELRQDPPPAPSEIYEKFGAMNGDYYTIAMEENLLFLSGNRDVKFSDPHFLVDSLEQSGEIPVSTRKSLREAVGKYGLEEGLIPEDPDFLANTAIETKGATFADVASDAWYAEAVTVMAASGIIQGKDDGLFHPDDTITIGEWCTILYRITYKNPVMWDTINEYHHWAAAGICYMNDEGLTQMALGGTAYPEGVPSWDAITQRGEAMTAVSYILEQMEYGYTNAYTWEGSGRYIDISGPWSWEDIPDADFVLQGTEHTINSRGFPDYGNTHYWNPKAVLHAYNYGFVNGTDSLGTCDPTGSVTRAQACQMLYKAGLDHHIGIFDFIQGGIM